MPTLLATGLSGLIGSHLAPRLAGEWEVVDLGRHPQAGPGREALPLDLAQPWEASALPQKLDAVVHLAQSEHFRDFPQQAASIYGVNVASTMRLLAHAQRVGAKSFVLASSGGIYRPGDQALQEDAPLTPGGDLGFYLGTKLAAEALAAGYVGHMNVIVLRFFFVYGPGQRPSMLVPRLLHGAAQGQPVRLSGPEGMRLNPTHVSDAANAIVKALALGGSHTINVAGPEVVGMRQLGAMVAEAVGQAPRFEVEEAAAPRHTVGDIQRMTELLGPPSVGLAEGLAALAEHLGLAPHAPTRP